MVKEYGEKFQKKQLNGRMEEWKEYEKMKKGLKMNGLRKKIGKIIDEGGE